MAVDPTEPETVEELLERTDDRRIPAETPEADAAEQRARLRPDRDSEPTDAAAGADPADLAEQSRVVELDEDDYR